MGGGTGTGAAPVIARAAKEQGILTVGVVTKPFHFEGARRMLTAERGIELLAKHVDTLIVIPNQNLFRVANEKTTFAAAFAMADQVLYSGVASITELMTKEGLINLDFADVRAIMSEMGKAMMGTGEATGEKRAIEAAEAAISNPLLDDVSMRGARGLLISITGGPDLTLYEVDEAATRIREEVDPGSQHHPRRHVRRFARRHDAGVGGRHRSCARAGGRAAAPKLTRKSRSRAPSRPVFGYTGKQPIAGEEAGSAGADGGAPQPAGSRSRRRQAAEVEEIEEEPMEEATSAHAEAAAQQQRRSHARPQPAPHAAVEEFPADRAAPDCRPAEPHRAYRRACQRKKRGLFERLAERRPGPQGRSRRPRRGAGDGSCARAQDAAASRRPRRPRPQPPDAISIRMLDDDQLEIPAFLRRQAN